MPYPIDRKLVVAVSASALFDQQEAGAVFRESGEDAYKAFQKERRESCLSPGVAFPFIKRFLSLNDAFPDNLPVEVVLLSKSDPEAGMRVMNSIKEYGLNISRAAFLAGKSPHQYIPAYNASIFLSANGETVADAIMAGHAAGLVLPGCSVDDPEDFELRVAFDFDGVIIDDEAEITYQTGGIDGFHASEQVSCDKPHQPGPLADLFRKLSYFQKLESKRVREDSDYRRRLRVAIVTSRNAPSHERALNTLSHWDVEPNETFFLGGIEKRRVLNVLKPHIYFDDQLDHLEPAAQDIPSVHIPFGIVNGKQGSGAASGGQ